MILKRHLTRPNIIKFAEHEKRKEYLEPSLEQRRYFTPFVVSCQGLFEKKKTQNSTLVKTRFTIFWSVRRTDASEAQEFRPEKISS